MPACLIDASVTLAWLFNEGGRGAALRGQLVGLELVAPWLWRLEVTQTVLKRERQHKLTEAQSTQLLQALEALEIEIVGEPGDRTLTGLAQMARPHQLSSYDAVYLDLAVRLNLPLLTDDVNLRAVAARVGVMLIEAAP